MSGDVGRYRKLYPRVWRHAGFCSLTKTARELALYLLTGPQTSRIGIFHFSIATAAEDLDVGAETLRKAVTSVCATFGWQFDAEARVFYIPSWWRFNMPENSNVLKGNLKDLNEIPFCALIEAFTENREMLPSSLHETFKEGCALHLGQRLRKQEQEQEQEQKNPSTGAIAPASLSRIKEREPASFKQVCAVYGALFRKVKHEDITSRTAALHDALVKFQLVAEPDVIRKAMAAVERVYTLQMRIPEQRRDGFAQIAGREADEAGRFRK
jgi:hypothetical protein